MLKPASIKDFKKRLRGSLLAPTDPDYEVARRVWNGMIDKRPALIAQCGATEMINWTRECWDALCPHVDRAVYVNALDDAVEEDDLRVRQAYGENYQRLKGLKMQYDPTNLFRQNSNIRPG